MRVPWPDQRCVVCLERPRADDEQTQMTDGHVLPQSIGGKLSAPFLCRRCNSKMGEAEAILPRDVTVRLIVDRLEHELPPELVKTIRYRQGYFADSEEYGRLSAGMDKEGELTPRQSETIKDDQNTLRQIASELRRHGATEEEIAKQQEAFRQAPTGDRLEVTPEYTVTKGIDFSTLPFRPNLDDPLTPPRVPLGIAYLYLALCLGQRVYDERALDPARQALRAAIAGDDSATLAWPVRRCGTNKTESKHALGVKAADGDTLIVIWLFRELVWEVRFPGVTLNSDPFYLLDLVTGEEGGA